MGQYQKKHSPTHTHPDHQTHFINFLHLLRSIASSLFSLRAWQSFFTTSLCRSSLITSWSGTLYFILHTFLETKQYEKMLTSQAKSSRQSTAVSLKDSEVPFNASQMNTNSNKHTHLPNVCTVSQKITIHLTLQTSPNVNRFSQFFHWHIHQKTWWNCRQQYDELFFGSQSPDENADKISIFSASCWKRRPVHSTTQIRTILAQCLSRCYNR